LHGFFWVRCEQQLPWKTIRQLIGDARFDSFHLHLATDPGTSPAQLPSSEDMVRHRITTSTWFENKADLNAVMERANVYFAPRVEEGIGQSFLEAMGRGQCVVAPNQGTMNEYILPGVNGLLYELNAPKPLDFTAVHSLGAQAKSGTEAGRAVWDAAEADLVRFILTPAKALYAGKYQHAFSDDATATPTTVPGLRGVAQRLPIFRSTRFLWHPVLRMARRIRSHFV